MSIETESNVAEQTKSQISQDVIREFCNRSIETMCLFYGANRMVFENKLTQGYSKISFGRSPYGFSDESKGYYFSAFAAFRKNDSSKISVLEVKKEVDFPLSFSFGLKEKEYSQKQYEKIKERYKLILFEEDLNSFIQGFPWPSKPEPIN